MNFFTRDLYNQLQGNPTSTSHKSACDEWIRRREKRKKYILDTLQENERILNDRFHDARIIDSKIINEEIDIVLDCKAASNPGGIVKVHFFGVTNSKGISLCKDCWWLFEEVYKTKDGFTIMVLLSEGEIEIDCVGFKMLNES